jgi:hypothetical protein
MESAMNNMKKLSRFAAIAVLTLLPAAQAFDGNQLIPQTCEFIDYQSGSSTVYVVTHVKKEGNAIYKTFNERHEAETYFNRINAEGGCVNKLTVKTLTAHTRTFRASRIWGLEQNNSGAPSPSCPCDQNSNVRDCPASFETNEDFGDICYDEYIPEGSDGYVYAQVFQPSAE